MKIKNFNFDKFKESINNKNFNNKYNFDFEYFVFFYNILNSNYNDEISIDVIEKINDDKYSDILDFYEKLQSEDCNEDLHYYNELMKFYNNLSNIKSEIIPNTKLLF